MGELGVLFGKLGYYVLARSNVGVNKFFENALAINKDNEFPGI